jgi:hypothetical protein
VNLPGHEQSGRSPSQRLSGRKRSYGSEVEG